MGERKCWSAISLGTTYVSHHVIYVDYISIERRDEYDG